MSVGFGHSFGFALQKFQCQQDTPKFWSWCSPIVMVLDCGTIKAWSWPIMGHYSDHHLEQTWWRNFLAGAGCRHWFGSHAQYQRHVTILPVGRSRYVDDHGCILQCDGTFQGGLLIKELQDSGSNPCWLALERLWVHGCHTYWQSGLMFLNGIGKRHTFFNVILSFIIGAIILVGLSFGQFFTTKEYDPRS